MKQVIRITLDIETTLHPGPAFELAHSMIEDHLNVIAGSGQKIGRDQIGRNCTSPYPKHEYVAVPV